VSFFNSSLCVSVRTPCLCGEFVAANAHHRETENPQRHREQQIGPLPDFPIHGFLFDYRSEWIPRVRNLRSQRKELICEPGSVRGEETKSNYSQPAKPISYAYTNPNTILRTLANSCSGKWAPANLRDVSTNGKPTSPDISSIPRMDPAPKIPR